MKLSVDKEMTDSCKVSNHPLPDNIGQLESSDIDEMDRPRNSTRVQYGTTSIHRSERFV
jgi:hypothetical protein